MEQDVAKWFAMSLPMIPICLGTHKKLIVKPEPDKDKKIERIRKTKREVRWV